MLTVDQAIEAILSRCRALPAGSKPLDPRARRAPRRGHRRRHRPSPLRQVPDGRLCRPIRRPGDRRGTSVPGDRGDHRRSDADPARPEGEAARIMTGAPLPLGADAVVMVERSRQDGPDVVLSGPVHEGQNRLIRGREMKAGEILLGRGTLARRQQARPDRLGRTERGPDHRPAAGRDRPDRRRARITLRDPPARPDPQLERGDAPGAGHLVGLRERLRRSSRVGRPDQAPPGPES